LQSLRRYFLLFAALLVKYCWANCQLNKGYIRVKDLSRNKRMVLLSLLFTHPKAPIKFSGSIKILNSPNLFESVNCILRLRLFLWDWNVHHVSESSNLLFQSLYPIFYVLLDKSLFSNLKQSKIYLNVKALLNLKHL